MQVKHPFPDRKDSKHPLAFLKRSQAVSVQTLLQKELPFSIFLNLFVTLAFFEVQGEFLMP